MRTQAAEREASYHGCEVFHDPPCQPAHRAVEMPASVSCTISRETENLRRFHGVGKRKQFRCHRLWLRKWNRSRFVSRAAHDSEDNAASHFRLCAWTQNTRSGIFHRRFHSKAQIVRAVATIRMRGIAYCFSCKLKTGGSRMNPQIIREFLQEFLGNSRDCDSMARMTDALTASVNAESSIFGGNGCGFSSAINS